MERHTEQRSLFLSLPIVRKVVIVLQETQTGMSFVEDEEMKTGINLKISLQW